MIGAFMKILNKKKFVERVIEHFYCSTASTDGMRSTREYPILAVKLPLTNTICRLMLCFVLKFYFFGFKLYQNYNAL